MIKVMLENLWDLGAMDFCLAQVESMEQAESIKESYTGHPKYGLIYIVKVGD